MTPEIEKHLMAYVDKLESLAKQGADIAQEQIPLVLQEYILYSRAVSTAGVLLALILLTIALISIKKAFQPSSWPERQEFPVGIVYSVVSIVLLIVSVPMILVDSGNSCLKAWCAPRVLLIEKLNDLRK